MTNGVATAAPNASLAAGLQAVAFATGLPGSNDLAIAVAGKTDARFAPSADATVHFTLPEGAKVFIREDRGAWALVERADGQDGWVKADAIERVGIATAK